MPLSLWAALVVAVPVAGLVLFALITFRLRFDLSIAVAGGGLDLSLRVGPLARRVVLPRPAGERPSRPRMRIPRPGPRMATAIARAGLRVLAAVRIRSLSWTSEIGLRDAAQVARAAGLAWAAKSSAVSALAAAGRLGGAPRLAVRPRFNQTRLVTRVQCILLIRGGDIISALAVAGYSLLKRQREVWFKWPRHRIPSRV